ncbi:glutamate racemase [Candidatus Uhrbacteria bacterium]|nr:glutamate racemase [Candidatus Uhrbacteria bacterium]MBD3284424.1 glutamate racemase [Candidatus Uhrbacteria bacterium]
MLGIFDSGVGGLTVVRELLRRHPNAAFEYLGDTARTPYGTKGPETIQRYAVEDVQYLIEQGAHTIVVACNTVSAHAMEVLRTRFTAVRFIDVIEPAVRCVPAAAHVGIIGTSATIRSGVYERLIRERNPAAVVHSVACPLFVPLVEEGWFSGPVVERVVASYLHPLKELDIDTLILGCTHYPMLQSAIRSYLDPKVRMIDSPTAVLNAADLGFEPGRQRYAFTDLSETACTMIKRCNGKCLKPKQILLH